MKAVDLYVMTEAIGGKAWSDDLLGKLLAWAHVTGFMECTVQAPIYEILMVAAHRFNIEGGKVPRFDLLSQFYTPRVKELQQMKTKTPWLPDLMERYKVTNWERMEYTWTE